MAMYEWCSCINPIQIVHDDMLNMKQNYMEAMHGLAIVHQEIDIGAFELILRVYSTNFPFQLFECDK